MNPFNYYPISLETYLFVTLGALGFIIGFCLLGKGQNHKFDSTKSQKLSDTINKISRSWILQILAILSTIFMIPFDIIVLTMENGDQIQDVIQELFAESSAYFIYSYFVFPLKNLCTVSLCYCLIKFKPKFIIPIILYLSQVISYSIVSGARADIINLLIYFLIIFITVGCTKKATNVLYRKGLAIIAMGISCYFLLIIMTGYRTTGKFEVTENSITEGTSGVNKLVVAYGILPYQLLDIALTQDYFNKLGGPYYGKATFAGYFTFLKNPLKKIGFHIKTYDNSIQYMNDTWLSISPTEQRNFAYTAFFLNYIDFGIIGVFFMPLIFGLTFRKIILIFYGNESFPMFLLLCICFIMLKSSIFISDLIVPYKAFYFAILIVWSFIDFICKKYKFKLNYGNY